MATLMQMWNMVIGGEGYTPGSAGADASESINPTHGMPSGQWIPGMRGHLGVVRPGLETGIGPSYGPGAPYTATNTQSIVAAIVRGEWAAEAAEAAPTEPINIQAPAGTPPATSPVQDQGGNGPSSPPVITVGQGQSKKNVYPMYIPGSNVSQGEKSAAAVIAGMMTDPQPPAKVAYEQFTQQALQATPPATNPQATRANTRNSNVVNGRKATGGANQSQGYNPHSTSPQPTPPGYMQGAVQSTSQAKSQGYSAGRA